mgnify:CR=1 FL=1
MKLKLLEPLKEFFKDEVRILGKSLNLRDMCSAAANLLCKYLQDVCPAQLAQHVLDTAGLVDKLVDACSEIADAPTEARLRRAIEETLRKVAAGK